MIVPIPESDVDNAEAIRLGIQETIFSLLRQHKISRKHIIDLCVPDCFLNSIMGLCPKAGPEDRVLRTAADPRHVDHGGPDLIQISRRMNDLLHHQPGNPFKFPIMYASQGHRSCQKVLRSAQCHSDYTSDNIIAANLYKFARASRTLRDEIRATFLRLAIVDVPMIKPSQPDSDAPLPRAFDLGVFDIPFFGIPLKRGLTKLSLRFGDDEYDAAQELPVALEQDDDDDEEDDEDSDDESEISELYNRPLHPRVTERMRQDVVDILNYLPDVEILEIITDNSLHFNWLACAGVWATLLAVLKSRKPLKRIYFIGGRCVDVASVFRQELPRTAVMAVAWQNCPCIYYGTVSKLGRRDVPEPRYVLKAAASGPMTQILTTEEGPAA